ncbi:hypothetical protein [Fimbriiglobus ruber]|uniref:hypothetical protein n=1 Tax=Fimbriiglobus ruber TaxID=1908690 RepID=UPI000B4B9A4D|nr:hypothetical protein [Fimbriiglobus ruber]
MADKIQVKQRREAFAALVAAQDTGLDVDTSRKQVAAKYGITTKTMEKIENEGLEAEWPPLDA